MSRLSQAEFESIVDAVAAEQAHYATVVQVGRFWVELAVRSGSGKSTWQATCTFDPQTAYYESHSSYRNASGHRRFFDEVQRRMKEQMT